MFKKDYCQKTKLILIVGCIYSIFFCIQFYTFNVNYHKNLYKKSETLELKAILKGVIHNPDMLSAEFINIDKKDISIGTKNFKESGDGEYILWRDLNDLKPGVYRVEVFFKNYSNSNFLFKTYLKAMSKNDKRKRFIFRIIE